MSRVISSYSTCSKGSKNESQSKDYLLVITLAVVTICGVFVACTGNAAFE